MVRRPDGTVQLDATGKEPGRGAYVHRSESCLEAALRRGALARALKAEVPAEVGNLLIDVEGVSPE